MRGKSPFVGDTNHFSHRLAVACAGMSRRTAVLCLYLITAATAVAAIILAHAPTTFVAILVFLQTLLILGVVMLLEQRDPAADAESPRCPQAGASSGLRAAATPRLATRSPMDRHPGSSSGSRPWRTIKSTARVSCPPSTFRGGISARPTNAEPAALRSVEVRVERVGAAMGRRCSHAATFLCRGPCRRAAPMCGCRRGAG